MATSLVDRGLLAIGVQQPDLRPRFLNYAADHFALLARGEKPPRPEPFLAEIAAEVMAATVGAEVPLPIQPPEKRTYSKKREVDDGPIDSVADLPEAETWLRSHGVSKIHPKTMKVVSAFMQHPTRRWRSSEFATLVGGSKGSLTQVLVKLKKKGIVQSEGERGGCRWFFSEMPARV